MKKTFTLFAAAVILFGMLSCSGNSKEGKIETAEVKKDSANKPEEKKEETPSTATTKLPPIVNIIDTVSIKGIVVYMKDSAASMDRIGMKLADIYGKKLGEVLKKNKLTVTGKPVAWYNSNKAPYFFEAGIYVDKKPSKIPSNVYTREIGMDSVSVAHFYGPYNLLSQGYDALNDRMKDQKRTIKSKPYEIYVDDPMDSTGKLKDPYKVRTDIVFPWK